MHSSVSDPAAVVRPQSLTLAPLDVPLSIEAGRVHDLDRLASACRRWMGSGGNDSPHLRISLQNAEELAGRGHVRVAVSGAKLTVEGPGVRAWARAGEGRATALVSSEYLDHPGDLADEVLEPLILRLVTREDRTPLHASGVVVDGLAIVLAGPSGAGKSCLARAADAAGLQLLSDDAVYVQTSPRLRVWGWPSAAHLLPDDAGSTGFPTRVRNGRRKFVVPLRSASVGAVNCERAVLCVLGRGSTPALRAITTDEAMRRLWPLDPGFAELAQQSAAAIGALSARGAWELRLSDAPPAAIRLLLSSIDRLKQTALT